ncbi:MAG: hypothetical protein K1X74_00370 [Pirellulales bacterium]|nr:hypothetical protein [Pirellulales bacterium]
MTIPTTDNAWSKADLQGMLTRLDELEHRIRSLQSKLANVRQDFATVLPAATVDEYFSSDVAATD